MLFLPKWSSSKHSEAQLANLWSLTLRFWLSSVILRYRSKSRLKIRQVEVWEIPSFCVARRVDSFEFSCTFSKIAAMFSADRAFFLTYGCWLIVYWAGLLEFAHQTLENGLWSATSSAVKRINAATFALTIAHFVNKIVSFGRAA